MNRRRFLQASLLPSPGRPIAGLTAHGALTATASALLMGTPVSFPDLTGVAHWFNSEPLRKRSLRGKVVMVSFWTYSCINSLRPLPFLRYWDALYRNAGLVLIGIHTPEFTFEKQRASVASALREFQVRYPVAMDNDYRLWRSLKNECWPSFYLFDSEGRIRFRRFGEGQYVETEREIRTVLKETGPVLPAATPVPIPTDGVEAPPGMDVRTPETYVGYRRAERFSSPEQVTRDLPRTYTAPENLRRSQWGLSGVWEVASESALLRQAHGKLILRFHSRDLHLVLAPNEPGRPIPFQVRLDGSSPGVNAGIDSGSDGAGTIREPRLYQLIRQKGRVRERLFEIEFLGSGTRAFAFTFG